MATDNKSVSDSFSRREIVPKTIEGIKRLAKTIKKESGIQHAKALDIAAQKGGFNNYVEALRKLKA